MLWRPRTSSAGAYSTLTIRLALGIAHSFRVAGLVAVAAMLLAVVLTTAPARGATTFVHSAKSGEFTT